MTSDERTQQVTELVKSALECAGAERATFLDEACAGDAEMRAQVDSFLQFEDEASQFIEQGALHVAAQGFADRSGFSSPRQIDDYQVLSRLGIGGMGEVYLAQDTKLGRKVALKLVRPGMDTAEIVTRFRYEEQILASLNHTNIAQLYGAGVAAGDVPFFAMEYVDGVRIDEYCKARALSTAARLELFRKVCAAVHYAHQRLVIHRDLKPSNILVTAEGEPKLLDFGIARLVEGQDAFTKMQTLAGVMTPDYASPEQVRGEAMTISSDIYSLGVLLYEILTGQRPYRLKSRAPDEIARAITDQIPERPSTACEASLKLASDRNLESRAPSLRGDLDNIVLMAMRKEPARRYASVEQFSEDIRRHLKGLPVVARKDTFPYRSGKFIRRHTVGVAAAALIGLSLVGGIIATLWEARRATEQRDRAERRFADVRKLSNALLFEIAPKIERLEGSTEARRSLVDRALEYLDSLAHESGGDHQLQSELAAAYEKVGELQGAPRKPNLSDYGGAIASYEKARDIRKRLREKNPSDFENLRSLARDLSALSSIRWWTSDTSGSLEDSRTALAAYGALLARQPGSIDLQLAAAESQIDLGNIFYFNEQLAQVYPPLRQALSALGALRERDPENIETLRLLGRGHTLLGLTLSWDDKQKEGEQEMAEAFAIYEPLAGKHPQDSVIRQGLLEMYLQGSQLFEVDNPAHSFEILLKARAVAENSITSDAADVQARQNLAKTHARLGVIALHLGRTQDAIVSLEKSLVAFGELGKLDPSRKTYKTDVGRMLMYLGQAKHQQRAFDDALVAFARAAAVFEDIAQEDPQNNQPVRKLATVYQCIADVHRDLAEIVVGAPHQAHLETARENYRRALDILLALQVKKALAEYDLKYVEDVRTALSELERR